MLSMIKHLITRFDREESGLALTEYLLLLGLLTGGVLASVILIGGNLGDAWDSWSNWFDTADICVDANGTSTGC